MRVLTPCPMFTVALLGCTVLAQAAPSSQTEAGQPGAGQPGTWQKHEYSFAAMTFTSTYSCDGLADRLKILLIASGARSDAKANPGACANGFGRPDRFARADLVFYTLTPAAAGNPVAGKPVAGNPATVDGKWTAVAMTARKPSELRTGDCELVEQFQSSVLPMFTTRNIESHTTCVPYQESGSVIDLRFESFGAVPLQAVPKPGSKATP